MKHVIVLHNPSSSATLLDAQGLNDARVGANGDTSKPNALQSVLRGTDKRMQSTDGIQFYQFKQKYPRKNTGMFLGSEHLEYWSRALETPLSKKRETLDAIVIPEPTGKGPLSYDKLKDWLAEVKGQWPNVKVMVVRPSPDSGYADPVTFVPIEPDPARPAEQVTAYKIPANIDAVCLEHNNFAANELRALLGMPERSAKLGRG